MAFNRDAIYAKDAGGNVLGLMGLNGQIYPVANTYTWTQLQALTGQAAGTRAYVSTFNGAEFVYDGTRWRPVYPVALLSGGPPFIMPGGGSFGNNGALTLTTALPLTYPGAFMYFPVNAIGAGVAAGWYWVVMSSASAGTVYNTTYTGGQPSVPSAPFAFVTTGPGAYTQSVGSTIAGIQYTVPAGVLGISGGLEYDILAYSKTSSGVAQIGYGGATSVNVNSSTFSGNVVFREMVRVRNAGLTNRQVTAPQFTNQPFGMMSGQTNSNYLSTDSTVAQIASVIGYINTSATDYVVIDQYNLTLLP